VGQLLQSQACQADYSDLLRRLEVGDGLYMLAWLFDSYCTVGGRLSHVGEL
jgi:hypothetical protein